VLQHLKGDKVIVFKRKEEKDTKREMVTDNILLKLIEGILHQVLKKLFKGRKKVAEAKVKSIKKKGDDLKLIEGVGPKVQLQ
jgi:large subunit ribosomal protein L21